MLIRYLNGILTRSNSATKITEDISAVHSLTRKRTKTRNSGVPYLVAVHDGVQSVSNCETRGVGKFLSDGLLNSSIRLNVHSCCSLVAEGRRRRGKGEWRNSEI